MLEAMPDNAKVSTRVLHSETFTIHKNPTPQEIAKTMIDMSAFLTRYAVDILDKKITTAANPAPNAMLQSAATLELGASNFAQIVAMASGLAQPGAPQGPQRRM